MRHRDHHFGFPDFPCVDANTAIYHISEFELDPRWVTVVPDGAAGKRRVIAQDIAAALETAGIRQP